MQGIIYFGLHSFDEKFWASADILESLTEVEGAVDVVNGETFASLCIPADWTEFNYQGVNFWDRIYQVAGNDQILVGVLSSQIHSRLMRDGVDNGVTFALAIESLEKGIANEDDLEYYLAFKSSEDWPNINGRLNIANAEELFNAALAFLVENPINEENYAQRSAKIFPNLNFHENFAQTLRDHGKAKDRKAPGKQYRDAKICGICGFSKSVTDSLRALNSIDITGKTPQNIIEEVRDKGFDCSVQGQNKGHLKFSVDTGMGVKEVNCEFHIKIHDENTGGRVYYQDRLYFGLCETPDGRKIFVAHSGKHL